MLKVILLRKGHVHFQLLHFDIYIDSKIIINMPENRKSFACSFYSVRRIEFYKTFNFKEFNKGVNYGDHLISLEEFDFRETTAQKICSFTMCAAIYA